MKTESLILRALCLFVMVLRAPAAIFYVDASDTVPQAPFATWATAATNIQDAIDLTSSGDTVLVTNGTYAYGGRIMAGDLVNRIALTNAITVQSINGPVSNEFGAVAVAIGFKTPYRGRQWT